MKRACREFENNIDSLIKDKLEPALKQQALAHMDSCPSCSADYKNWQKVTGLLEYKERIALPENFSAELHRKLESASAEKAGFFPGLDLSGFFRIARPAAVFALVLLVMFPVYLMVSKKMLPGKSSAVSPEKVIVLNFNIQAQDAIEGVNFAVNLPDEMSPVDGSGFTVAGNVVSWQGDLEKGNNEILIKVKATRGGDWNIKARLEKGGRIKAMEKIVSII
ncbi:MAG: hypothetical protein A2297_01420 [Elusimicrobia bacterium RIFOXYB2_FULL_48_7]|nr:MAG: hypothetical protein A2297_01420 [Elusimicrobia bacterium RIFOXYB2_FULL_48_7]